ncbi:hypothetical protein [Streptomyces sp. NPDC005533]|uniref:hypothetical protein n=1 Tax=Streptomyces sp. NPDC005533 TaxID=3364723 RepID=UPI00367F427B
MNPSTYAALYGPWQRAKPAPKERPAVAVLAALLWAVTTLSFVWLGGLFSIALLWGAAAGQPVGGLLLRLLLVPVGAAAVLTAVGFVPAVRRLAVSSRLLLLGALACPAPTTLAIMVWLRTA